MKYNRAIIVTNGTLTTSCSTEISKDDYVIGFDRAAYWLLTHGILPNSAVGDFDSTSKDEFEQIKKSIPDIRPFPPEKEYVDTELAILVAFEKKFSEIVIFGGLGTRLDHTLATLSLLELGVRNNTPIRFKNDTNELSLFSRGRTIVKKRGEFKYISIIPYTPKIIISLDGLTYPLVCTTISRVQTIVVSNKFITDSSFITLHSGM